MASMDDLDPRHRTFVERYRFRVIDPTPCTPLRMPLSEARVGLVSTAGLHHRDTPPFRSWIPGGDVSFRELSSDVDLDELVLHHRSEAFDPADALRDPNVVWPRDRLLELVGQGVVGSLAESHPSFMGSITAPSRLIRRTAVDAAERLREQGTNLVLLAPA